MASKAFETERKTYAVIRSGRKEETVETWRYYSIVEILRWLGAERADALETAKWCGRTAKPGDRKTIEPSIIICIQEGDQK